MPNNEPLDYFKECSKLIVRQNDPIELDDYDCKPALGLFVDLREYESNMPQPCVFSDDDVVVAERGMEKAFFAAIFVMIILIPWAIVAFWWNCR